MIVVPKDSEELSSMLAFLFQYAGASPSVDMHVIGWVSAGQLQTVVGIGNWLGQTCQMHVAFAPDWHFTPRELLHKVFRHAFIIGKRKLVFGIVNSKNEKALRFDLHLGFKEMWRVPEMHDDGGDIVILGMRKDQCRYLEPISETAGHA